MKLPHSRAFVPKKILGAFERLFLFGSQDTVWENDPCAEDALKAYPVNRQRIDSRIPTSEEATFAKKT